MPEKENYKILFTELNDIVHFTPVASSFYEKEYIDEVAFYWLSDQRKYQLKHPDVDESNIQEGQYAQRRLAMWAYVYFVLHDKKSNDSWIEYETEAKKKMRILKSLSFLMGNGIVKLEYTQTDKNLIQRVSTTEV